MSSVDVIVPCYRYGSYLAACVGSVLSQACPVRVLILDDASPDETPEVAGELQRADPRVTYVRHARNMGHIATYNEGLDWASADYTLLISADDFVTPGALDRAVEALNASPGLGMVYGPVLILPNGGPAPVMPSARDRCPVRTLDARQFMLLNRMHNPVYTPSAITRTDLQRRLGGYRPDMPHAGDQEMWLRFALHAPVGRFEIPQAVWRRHGNNMSDGYYSTVRDLEQRRLVLDTLFEGTRLAQAAGVEDLKQAMYAGLAQASVRASGPPFLRGDQAEVERLMQFAQGLDPTIRRSLLWRLYRIKLRMGPRAWQRVEPLFAPMARTIMRARQGSSA